MHKLNKTIHNNEPIGKPIIIHATGKVAATFTEEKAKRIAQLEEEVYKLTAALPDKVTLRPSLYFIRNKQITSLHFVKSSLIIDQKQTEIFFSYSKQKENVFGNESSVDTQFKIKLNFFSDYELGDTFQEFLASHPNDYYFPATEYLFDNNGNAVKVIWSPSAFSVQRKVLFDAKIYRIYVSEITKEDVEYVEQALMLLKMQVEAYQHS